MATIQCNRCGTENDPEQARWYYCSKCGSDLRVTEATKRDNAHQPDTQVQRRVYSGAGFEANAFLAIGCAAFPFAAWLVYMARTERPGMISIAPYLLLGAVASIAGGVFLIVQCVKRRGLSVEVSSEAIVIRDGYQVTESVPVGDIVNFFDMAGRDLLNRPLLTRPRYHFLISRTQQVRLPDLDGTGEEEMCQHITDLLCARHLGRLRSAVAQASYQIAEGVVITPTGVSDARNQGDGLAWGELAFDTGSDPNDDEKLRMWKRGALLTSWRVIAAQEITLFPVVLALIHELCKEDAEKVPSAGGA